MLMKFWLNTSGHVIVDEDGQPIFCDVCPCGGNYLLCATFSEQLEGREVMLDLSQFEFGLVPDACNCEGLDTSYMLPRDLGQPPGTYLWQDIFPMGCETASVFYRNSRLELQVQLQCLVDSSVRVSVSAIGNRGVGGNEWAGGGFRDFPPGTFGLGATYEITCGFGAEPFSPCAVADNSTQIASVTVL